MSWTFQCQNFHTPTALKLWKNKVNVWLNSCSKAICWNPFSYMIEYQWNFVLHCICKNSLSWLFLSNFCEKFNFHGVTSCTLVFECYLGGFSKLLILKPKKCPQRENKGFCRKWIQLHLLCSFCLYLTLSFITKAKLTVFTSFGEYLLFWRQSEIFGMTF